FAGTAQSQPMPVGNLPAVTNGVEVAPEISEVSIGLAPQALPAPRETGAADGDADAPVLPGQLPSSRVSLPLGMEQLTSPAGLQSSLQSLLLIAVLSLAPAILLMTTSFVRIAV